MVTGDEKCSTHIHISLVPNYSLQELKWIASAVIQFEPAFVALMPYHRRGNAYIISNWFGSPYLARRGKSRPQSIEEIEQAVDEVDVFRLIQGYKSANFCWNFYSLFGSKKTIEFRQPPASLSLSDALSWAEFAMTFVQAAMSHGSSLRNFSSNVGGLRAFMRKVNVPGMHEPDRLGKIWENKPDNAAIAPEEISGAVMKGMDKVDMLTKEVVAELRHSLELQRSAGEPHRR